MNRRYIENQVDILWHKISMYPLYQNQLHEQEKQIKEYHDKLMTVGQPKAITFDKEVFSSSGKEKESIYNELISKQMKMEGNLEITRCRLKELETIRDLVEDDEIREIIHMKFFEGCTWEHTCKKFFRDRRSLVRAIRRELSKLIHDDLNL